MSWRVLSPKVPLASDPPHSNTKWHAWLFSWSKSFLLIIVICRSLPGAPFTPVWGRRWKQTIAAWKGYIAEKSDETMIFFICRLLFFDFKKSRKLTSDPKEDELPSCSLVRVQASECRRVYFWTNFDEICYVTEKKKKKTRALKLFFRWAEGMSFKQKHNP